MLSLSKTPTSRCLASRQGRAARPAVSSSSLLQGNRRRLRPVSAVPGEPDKDLGLVPESGTGGSGLGRSQGTARPLSASDDAGFASAPESGTRASKGTPSSTSGSSSSSSGGRASEDAWAAQQAGQQGGSSSSGSQSGGAHSSALTGQVPGGSQEVSAGWEVPSSDTNPALDPAESKKYTERETQGSTQVPSSGSGSKSGSQSSGEPRSMGQQGSGSGKGRDESDMQMGGEESGGSSTRSHPVARTAATAIGSAAGTILGAVGGPVGAAAGAALGGGAGRRIADALAGDEGQAEVYDQGAEPEQVAEELVGARDAVGERLEGARDAAADLAGDIKHRAKEAKDSAQEQLHRASERSEHASRDAKQQMKGQQQQQGRARDDMDDLQGSIGARVQFAADERSGRADTGGSSSGSHEHGKGLGGKISDAAKTAAGKVGAAADAVTGHAQFPEYPPAEGKASNYDNIGSASSSSGSGQGEQRLTEQQGSSGGRVQSSSEGSGEHGKGLGGAIADAAKTAAEKVGAAADAVTGHAQFPEYPPAEGKASNYDNIGSASSSQGEGGSGGSGSGQQQQQQQGQRGREAAMPASAAAAASAAPASDAGWDTADQKWDWGGLPDAEAAVKADVGAPSLMQQDGMDLAGALGTGEGLARRDSERVGALDAAAAGGEERTADSGAPSLGRADGLGMAGAVGGAGGYGGGASEFGEGMDQMRAQGSGDAAAGESRMKSASSSSGAASGRAGNEGLPEGQLAAGGDDAQAATSVRRDESAGAATSDSTAERVAQVYGVGAEAGAGVEEAEVYKKEAGQEEVGDEGARKAFEGA
ncbi:hypothetical protein OEZ86_013721 [Tetradesmus obliquus]|nr:hypothetical protein OEZ86_013721 [Tetradesmus obliquus]